MLHDLLTTIQWYAPIFFVGIFAFIFLAPVFDKFYDRGYAFSKIIGLTVFSFVVFLLSFIKVARFNAFNIYFIFIILILLLLNRGYAEKLKNAFDLVKQKYKILIFEEVLFVFALFFWAYLRALRPELNTLEKFMDFGFINSIMRTDFMPPQDMWLAGHPINYYYYGHYLTAFLTKLSFLKANVTFNLMVATLFAFAFSLTFSFTSNLIFLTYKKIKPAIAGGLMSAFFIIFAGNLQTIIFSTILPILKKIGLFHGEIGQYWYPQATRYIGYMPPVSDKTIHEFPAYSFIVSDLHGHVLDIPFVLTALVLIYLFILHADNFKNKIITCILLGITLAIIFMTNTWDAPALIVLGVVAAVIPGLIKRDNRSLISNLFTFACFSYIGFFIFIIPFMTKFQFFSHGIGLATHHTPLYQFLVLWGFFILCLLIFQIIFIQKIYKKKLHDTNFSQIYVFILLIMAFCLTLVPEVIYIKDIYGAEYQRANTMFKFTFEAFIVYSVTIGYVFVYALREIKKKWIRYITVVKLGLVFLCSFIFIFYGVPGYYGKKVKIMTYKYIGLDGTAYLKSENNGEYELLKFLDTIHGQPVVAEAFGDSYSAFNMRSAYTGLPTPVGWYVHEWLWRGQNKIVDDTQKDVTTLYTAEDNTQIKQIIEKYQIKYVIVGSLEYQKFPNLNKKGLESMGKIIFTFDKNEVIKID